MESPAILVVEDELLIQMDVEDALQSGGYETASAPNGTSAVELLNSDMRFRALITDIKMPGELTGWDVARHAREITPGIAVVYITGDSVAQWQSRGVPNSVVIQKPFAPAQILTAVSQLLNAMETVVQLQPPTST